MVLIADTPKVMTEGNWRLGVYIDDGASDEQFDRLVAVFGGRLGGPMGALAPLVGEVHPWLTLPSGGRMPMG